MEPNLKNMERNEQQFIIIHHRDELVTLSWNDYGLYWYRLRHLICLKIIHWLLRLLLPIRTLILFGFFLIYIDSGYFPSLFHNGVIVWVTRPFSLLTTWRLFFLKFYDFLQTNMHIGYIKPSLNSKLEQYFTP